MITLNLIALFFVAVILTSLCKNRRLKAVVAAIFGVFTCMQLVSLYVGGSFCDYKFFVHFNFRDFWWGATNAFKFEIWLLPVALFGISAGIFFLSKLWFLQNAKPFIFIKCGVLIFFLLVLVAAKNGIVDNLRKVYIMYAMPELDNFDDIYKSIIKVETSATSSVNVTKKEELQASSEGKNIVVISLESFNRAYFLDKNQQLVPKLRELKQQWNFYPMYEHWSSGWTAASLYTTLTGLPTIFPGHGNSFFQSTKKSKLVSLIDVLEKAGYETHFLSDNAEFAGTKDLLTTFGTRYIWYGTLNGKYPEGMKDVELFAEAKSILQDAARTKPVMIYLPTIATHNPGFPDARLFSTIAQKETDLETAAYQTDYLVGDFVNFLKQQGFLENTIVYIFPDHPYMGRAAILNTSEKAGLWFLTNAAAEDLSIDTTNFYQIDLPRNILSGAKVKHNAVFLSDFIKGNKSEFIDENSNMLSALNAAHIEREKVLGNKFEAAFFIGKYAIGLIDDEVLFVDKIDTLLKYERCIFLSDELRVEHSALFEKGYMDSVCLSYSWCIRVGVKKNMLDVAWEKKYGSKKTLPLTAHLKMNHAGIKKTLAAISTEASITRAEEFPNDSLLLDYLPKILQDVSKVIAITCFDEASMHFAQLNPILKQVGLKESLAGCYRYSYVSVFSKSKVYFEKVGSREAAIHKKIAVGGVSFCLSSGGFDSPACAIAINGENYAACARGLNFVIFNTQTNQVEDAFNVDFYGDGTLKINRF